MCVENLSRSSSKYMSFVWSNIENNILKSNILKSHCKLWTPLHSVAGHSGLLCTARLYTEGTGRKFASAFSFRISPMHQSRVSLDVTEQLSLELPSTLWHIYTWIPGTRVLLCSPNNFQQVLTTISKYIQLIPLWHVNRCCCTLTRAEQVQLFKLIPLWHMNRRCYTLPRREISSVI